MYHVLQLVPLTRDWTFLDTNVISALCMAAEITSVTGNPYRLTYDDHITVFDTIMLFVRLEYLCLRFRLGVVDNLTVLIHIRTPYIDQFVM